MTRGTSEALPTSLPDRYERLFAWRLDRRCSAVRQIAADLTELWQDLGGVEHLSAQKRWLCERVVFLRARMVEFETAILDGKEPPMTHGEYSNFANVCVGHLKALGIERSARPMQGLQQYLTAKKSTNEGAP